MNTEAARIKRLYNKERKLNSTEKRYIKFIEYKVETWKKEQIERDK